MTGFGRGEALEGGLRVTVELRAVNHRFADLQVKVPRAYDSLQTAIDKRVRREVERGRVEIMVRRHTVGESARTVEIDESLAAAYAAAVDRLGERLGRSDREVPLLDLLALPGVVSVREAEVDPEAELPVILEAVDIALAALVGMREAEGGRLAADVRLRLSEIAALLGEIEEFATRNPERIRDRIVRRVQELLGDVEVDPARLLQEAAILADRAAIDEETTRLRSHLAQAEELLATPGAVGRRLDFLVQEFQRETNTIGSKASGSDVAPRVVAMKSLVEKIREQVANIE
jgi:uncharacterized protein (TIGR00255 family)